MRQPILKSVLLKDIQEYTIRRLLLALGNKKQRFNLTVEHSETTRAVNIVVDCTKIKDKPRANGIETYTVSVSMEPLMFLGPKGFERQILSPAISMLIDKLDEALIKQEAA